MNITTSIKKSLLVSASVLSAVGLLSVMPLSASAQLSPGSTQMTPNPSADEPGSTEDIRDDAAVESSQMEGDMTTPGAGTSPDTTPADPMGADPMGGETTGEVGNTEVPLNSSQTERDDATVESSQTESDSGTTTNTGTNNTIPASPNSVYSSPTNSSPTNSSPTTTSPSTTTTPAASTNRSPRALW